MPFARLLHFWYALAAIGRVGRVGLALLVLLALLAPPGSVEAEEARLVGPFAKAEYPQAVIDRPLVLPAGMVEGEIGGRFTSRRFEGPFLPLFGFSVGGFDAWDADLAFRVGVTDRLQIEAGTAFSLDYAQHETDVSSDFHPEDIRPSLTSWQRVVPLKLSFLALDTEALDTAVTLTLPFVAHARRSFPAFFLGRGFGRPRVVLANSDGRVLPAVELAAPTRWRLNDFFWLRAGENLFAVTTGEGVAQFAFDFGIGVQPHPLFAVTLDSRIASIAFDGDGHEASRTLAEVGTIDLEGIFSPLRFFDVVGSLVLPDTGRGFDDYVTRVAVRVRL